MPWAELMILDAAILIAVLVYYWGRPKPKWLQKEIRIMVWIAKALRIMKRAASRL
jgi:hypothetical protein